MAVTAKKRKPVDTDKSRPAKKAKTLSNFQVTDKGPSAFASVLTQATETDFPRGGGVSTLTPLEVRQAKTEARNEASQTDSKRRSKVLKRKSDVGATKVSGKEKQRDTIPIAHLTHKHLTVGTRILARIVSVRALELIVSLPNQLYGHIPATNISSHFTNHLSNLTEDSDEDEEESLSESDNGDSKVPSLSDMFSIGQTFPAVVSKIIPPAMAKAALSGRRKADEDFRISRRVELSLDPAALHAEMTKQDLVPNMTLLVAVKSIEDNGLILDLGVEGVTSFVPTKDLKSVEPILGQLLLCKIVKMSANGKTCTTSLVASPQQQSLLSDPPTKDGLLPGTLVQALVTSILPSGLNVKLFGLFDATINLFHVGVRGSQDITKTFKIGQKVKARILWNSGATIALSLLPHVVQGESETVEQIKKGFPVGTLLQRVTVVRIEDEYGVVCEIPGPATESSVIPAFAHISKISDEHLQSVYAAKESFEPGTFHKARVIGFSSFDGLVLLSFQASVLAQTFSTIQEIQIGQQFKAKVDNLTSDALFLNLGGHLQAVAWPLHYSDIRLKHPEKKFKPGVPVKARVFEIDPTKQRISVTLKKSLLESQLPIIDSIENARIGQDADAIVENIRDVGVTVKLFGGLKAFVPIAEVSDEYLKSAKNILERIQVGQAVKIRLLKVEPQKKHMLASIRKALTLDNVTSSLQELQQGSHVSAKVQAVHEKHYVLEIPKQSATVLLSFASIAKQKRIALAEARGLFQVNTTIDDLVILNIDLGRKLVNVGVPSQVKSTQEKETQNLIDKTSISDVISFDSIKKGQILQGKCTGRRPMSFLCSLGRGVTARLHLTDAADNFSLVEASFKNGESMPLKIIDIDREQKQIDVTARPSELNEKSFVNDPKINTIGDLASFLQNEHPIRGFVRNVSNGLFISLSKDITARIQIKELFDGFIQDWQSEFSVGQLVSGRIISINEENGSVEMSLKSKNAPKKPGDSFANLSVGQQVLAVVKKIEAYGIFLRIQGTSISGLCHKSEMAETLSENWQDSVAVGSEVRAVILNVEEEKKRVNFSMRPSRLGGMSTQVSQESDGDLDEEVEEDNVVLELQESDASPKSSDHEEGQIDIGSLLTQENEIKSLNLSSAFGTLPKKRQRAEQEDILDAAPSPKLVKTTMQAQDRTAEMQTEEPRNEADFERLVLSSPNSSLLWISYMAMYAATADVSSARRVAQRALNTINFREGEEKFNVWMAWLGLELQNGSDGEFQKVFKDAVKANEPKGVYLRAAELLQQSGKRDKAKQLFEEACKKFSTSSKVWTLFAAFLLETQQPEEARALLPKSLKLLPKRKHLKTIAKFGQSEFRIGDPETGRTIFQNVLDQYPRRLDLLATYVDLEIKQGSYDNARSLLKKALTPSNLPSRKAKWLFKKMLNLEESHGTSESQEEIKELARAYVESQSSKEEADESQNAED